MTVTFHSVTVTIEAGSAKQVYGALTVCALNKAPPEDVRVIRETFDHHLGPAPPRGI